MDRAFRKWKRNPVPEGGSGNGSLLVTIVISTNHLSAPRRELGEKIHWISPAPTGGAVKLDLFLTQEDRDSVERYFSDVGQRTLIYSEGMQNGSNLCLATMNVDCGPVDLQSPRNPLLSGQVFGDLVFPDFDDKNTGRPVRILIANNADPPVLWELGGYDSSRLSG